MEGFGVLDDDRVTPSSGRESQDLLWASRLLWGGSEMVSFSTIGDPPRGFRTVEAFAVLPSASRARLLTPLASRQAASASVRHFTVAMNVRAQLRKVILAAGMRAGLAQPLVRDRLRVSVADGIAPEELPRLLLKEHFRDALSQPDLELAVKLDKVRPNWKPVLQLLTSRGVVLGYAKVGWNGLTRRLVRSEAATLERYRSRRPRTFALPHVLYRGRWRDLEIVVVSPMPQPLLLRSRPTVNPPIAATREVATMFGVNRQRLGGSAYWVRTAARVAEARARGDGLDSDVLARVLSRIEERHGDMPFTFGSWHGDWAPWNMTSASDRVFVWDWERSSTPVPVGFDALHYRFQAALVLQRKGVPAAARTALAETGAALRALEVRPEMAHPLLVLYLLEIFLRYEESRAAGVKSSDQVSRELVAVLAERTGVSARR